MTLNKHKAIDITERVAATFAFTFLGAVLAPGFNVSDKHAFFAAAIAGGMSAGKYAFVQLNLYLGRSSA